MVFKEFQVNYEEILEESHISETLGHHGEKNKNPNSRIDYEYLSQRIALVMRQSSNQNNFFIKIRFQHFITTFRKQMKQNRFL